MKLLFNICKISSENQAIDWMFWRKKQETHTEGKSTTEV